MPLDNEGECRLWAVKPISRSQWNRGFRRTPVLPEAHSVVSVLVKG
jgi:hypothetical protein